MSEPALPGPAFAALREPLLQVEDALREQLASEGEVVRAVGDHVLSAGGKRMRPALVLLAAELCGYTGPRRVQVAAAVELLHTATLLHDDVVDLASVRRGRPSANAVWGNRRAILAGDFFYARSSAMIVEDGDLDILYVFSNTIRRMAEGELLQLEQSFDPGITEPQYYAVIERKSADLLAAAAEAGAILGGVTRAERRRLREFGRELGLAFQLRDDALDYDGGQHALGKAPLADVREGKITLPLLLALKRCTAAERERASVLLKAAAQRAAALDAQGSRDPEQVMPGDELATLVELVEKHLGVHDTNRRAEQHIAHAETAIAPFADGAAKRALISAARFAVGRDH